MLSSSRRASRRARSTILLLVARNSCPSWWRRSRPGIPRTSPGLGSGYAQLYRAQGHLLEVTDLVEKMQQVRVASFRSL